MLRLFIFSHSFIERTLIWNLDYLFDYKVKQIYLLKENHTQNETFDYIKKYTINICNSIEEAVYNSDIIIVIKDVNMPSDAIEKIIQYANSSNKVIKIISNPFVEQKSDFITNHPDYETINFGNVPVILTISLGVISQSYCTEILLDKIFKKKNIRTKHLYTYQTQNFLLELNSDRTLKKYISDDIKIQDTTDYDVIICSINIGSDILNIVNFFDIIRNVKADYVVLQTDYRFQDYKTASNFLKYACLTQLDMVVKSQYFMIDNERSIYCALNKNKNSRITKYLESISLESDLQKDIFLKMCLPENVIGIF